MPKRKGTVSVGTHGKYALSRATRRRLLADLLTRAEGGDVAAATALVLISLRVEPVETFAGQKAEAAAA
jgi:hypothetical protein